MAQQKKSKIFRPGIFKLILRILKLFFILFFGITIFWVILYRFVNPPVTWLMIQRGFERKADGK
jgi:monofunctional glycosyltransferase